MGHALDQRFMALALSLGRRGQGRTWPNPAVGCVITRGAQIIGRGWTQPTGRPHAETMALSQASTSAHGATAYVTLEPCAHHGKTPPCAEALIAAGISRVVVATKDPDPRVSGRGLAMLEAAGITVETGLLEADARQDLAGFLLKTTQNRPFITLKLANSFDGRIATASGDSHWITGPEARRIVHAMRARHDGVMVGAGTARADDPSLTIRDLGTAHQPIRIVTSRKLDLPTDSNLARTAHDIPLWICHGEDAPQSRITQWEALGATCLPCTLTNSQLTPLSILNALASQGLTRIFCEGGGTLAASLLTANLVDELIGFTAGVTIGAEGTPGIGALGLSSLAEAPRFNLIESRAVGGDVLHRWTPL